MAHQPHDSLFKAAFSRSEPAAGLLRSVLPAALVAQLDLGTLRLLHGSYVDEVLRKTHSDLVYEVQLAGRPALVCLVLHEHQSEVEDLMAVRLVGYLSRAWDAWLEDHSGATRVPPALALVLYHGAAPWSAPTSITETLEASAELVAAAGDYLPSWRFVLDDLNTRPDDDLRAREVGVFGRLALLLLKHARSLDAGTTGPGSLAGFFRSASTLLRALPDRGDRTRVFRYIFKVVTNATPATVEAALGDAATPEVREDMMTGADQLRLEGEARALRRVLQARFGALPATAEAHIASADQARLDAWLDAALTAERIEDVWASGSS